jgi:drug/metabolite transporter (DMT)-like permease
MLIAAMALVGANVAIGKRLVLDLPIYAFMLFRFVLASAALWLLARTEAGPRLTTLTASQARDLVIMALFGMVGFTVLMLEGLKRTAAADAGIITATLPAVVALLGALFAGDRLNPRQMVAVAMAVLGLVVIQLAGAGGGAASAAGNLLVAGAVLCEAIFVIVAKRLAATFAPFRLALGANLVGLVLSVPFLALDPPGTAWAAALTPTVLTLAVYYVLAASVFSLWFWYRGLPGVETWLAGIATAALPLTALAIAALVLGETLGPARVSGAVLVVAAIVVGAISPARHAP